MLKKFFSLLIITLIWFILLNPQQIKADEISFDDQTITAIGATYKVTSRTNDDSLDYGIRYIRDIALSSSTSVLNGTKNEQDPQVLNVLEVPSSNSLKVINWTFSSNTSWTKQTITKLAEDFEANNPGWVVLAGINGDFFDINGTGALQYQTSGAAVCNGEVYRGTSEGSELGFTNDGSVNSLIGNGKFQVEDKFTLTIYQDNEVIGEFKVDNVNSESTDNQISLYYTYNYFDSEKNRQTMKVTVPAANSYIVANPDRGYANSATKFYGKGVIRDTNKETTLNLGGFAIVTANEEVQNLLEKSTCIRVQQNVVGDYANCLNVTGCGFTLVNNSTPNSTMDGMSDYRHPRTMIGRKADGTIVLATVDGRQDSAGMYGMTYEEQSAAMLYYGCSEAYNLDGGGSTTMIIRNNQGGFDVMNSPSDGEERCDSNAILVVVPEMKLSINKATDTSVDISYNSSTTDILIENVNVKIESSTEVAYNQKIDSDKMTISGLAPNTDYSLTYSYDLKYQDQTLHNTSKALTFKTGVKGPNVVNATYELIDGYYLLDYSIEDENATITSVMLKYDKEVKMLNKNDTSTVIDASTVKIPTFTLIISYNVNATPVSSLQMNYVFEEYKEEEPQNNYDGPSEEYLNKIAKQQMLGACIIGGVMFVGIPLAVGGVVLLIVKLKKRKNNL